ncbi:hypothetical protein LZ554_001999 [Drepanopeziza brunnea f. sp. 'monogermtubi']|nr:hypothetical protein LZ554_001999 [Drepanopeziza brunnea f. sp. 'monogermtubi']
MVLDSKLSDPAPLQATTKQQLQFLQNQSPPPSPSSASARSMLMRHIDIPRRLYRVAPQTPKTPTSPDLVGFAAAETSIPFPRTVSALQDEVHNHLLQQCSGCGHESLDASPFISLFADKRAVEDQIMSLRQELEREELGFTGEESLVWVEEGLGESWRVWAVDGRMLSVVVRVSDFLEDGEGESVFGEYLAWKSVKGNAVYAVEGGGYWDIKKKRICEVMGVLDAARAEGQLSVEGSEKDEEEGRISIGESIGEFGEAEGSDARPRRSGMFSEDAIGVSLCEGGSQKPTHSQLFNCDSSEGSEDESETQEVSAVNGGRSNVWPVRSILDHRPPGSTRKGARGYQVYWGSPWKLTWLKTKHISRGSIEEYWKGMEKR